MEHLEYLCLHSNNCEEIKSHIVDNKIDINNADILKIICLRNSDELFKLFLDLNADFTTDNFQVIKYFAIIGDVEKLKYLIRNCNIDLNKFVLSSKMSTLTNSDETKRFIEHIFPAYFMDNIEFEILRLCKKTKLELQDIKFIHYVFSNKLIERTYSDSEFYELANYYDNTDMLLFLNC